MLRAGYRAPLACSRSPPVGDPPTELSETGEFLDGVAAVVNEGVVLKSQLRDQTAMPSSNEPSQYQPANAAAAARHPARATARERLIN